MAQSITPRTRLSMRDFERDPRGALRDLQRWADYLPFGRVGFEAHASFNQDLTNGTLTNITLDSLDVNVEGWTTFGSAIKVPAGLSGTYVFVCHAFFTTAVASAYVIIRSLDAAGNYTVHGIDRGGTAVDGRNLTGIGPVNDGDSISVAVRNFSGATITVRSYAGDTETPPMFGLKGYRISLL